MNIALITPEYHTYTNWGGVATFSSSLIDILTDLGHQVYCITHGNEAKTSAKRKHRNGTLTEIYVARRPSHRILARLFHSAPIQRLRALLHRKFPYTFFAVEWNVYVLLRFRVLARTVPFDVIHSTHSHAPGILVSLFYRNVPVIYHELGSQEFINAYEPPSLDLRLKSLIDLLFMLYFPKTIIACSPIEKRRLVRSHSSLVGKIMVIPNVISPAGLQTRLQPLDPHSIVYFGRVDYLKGVDLLLHAFIRLAEKNKQVRLTVIGESRRTFRSGSGFTDFFGLLKKQGPSENIKDRISYLPRVDDRKSLATLLGEKRGIAVFPFRFDCFAHSVIEAMAMGYVVIVSRQFGGRDLIEHLENGLLVRPSQQSLVGALEQCLRLGARRLSTISARAEQTVTRQLTVKAARDSYASLYRELERDR